VPSKQNTIFSWPLPRLHLLRDCKKNPSGRLGLTRGYAEQFLFRTMPRPFASFPLKLYLKRRNGMRSGDGGKETSLERRLEPVEGKPDHCAVNDTVAHVVELGAQKPEQQQDSERFGDLLGDWRGNSVRPTTWLHPAPASP
jgi:hypothetical protein